MLALEGQSHCYWMQMVLPNPENQDTAFIEFAIAIFRCRDNS